MKKIELELDTQTIERARRLARRLVIVRSSSC